MKKLPSGFHPIEGDMYMDLDDVTLEELKEMYQQHMAVQYYLLAFASWGFDIEDFPHHLCGLDKDQFGDYMVAIGEHMTTIESIIPKSIVKEKELQQREFAVKLEKHLKSRGLWND